MFRRMLRQANYFRQNTNFKHYESPANINIQNYTDTDKYKKMSTFNSISDEKIKNKKIHWMVQKELEKQDEELIQKKENRKMIFSGLVGILFFIVLLYEQRFIGIH
jgi:hypothetical protein